MATNSTAVQEAQAQMGRLERVKQLVMASFDNIGLEAFDFKIVVEFVTCRLYLGVAARHEESDEPAWDEDDLLITRSAAVWGPGMLAPQVLDPDRCQMLYPFGFAGVKSVGDEIAAGLLAAAIAAEAAGLRASYLYDDCANDE